MPEEKIGVVKHFFNHVSVAAAMLQGALKRGDTVHIHGGTTDFVCTVDSLQIDRKDVEEAGPGSDVGFKVPERVREGDVVYKVTG